MDVNARDEVTHRFLEDDARVLRSNKLRPQARLLHRALIRSVTPRTGSYEEVRRINLQALYAVYSSQRVNWAKWILDEFIDVSGRRRFKTFHYGTYIMRILSAYGVPVPDTEYTTISELGPRTLGLMGLEKRPRNLGYRPFDDWQANRGQPIPQPEQEEIEEEEDSGSEGVQIVTQGMSHRDAMITLSRNQSRLREEMKRNQKRTDRKFNSIRGFLNKIWEKVGCSGSSSSAAFDPAPFKWTSSSGTRGGNGGDDSETSSF